MLKSKTGKEIIGWYRRLCERCSRPFVANKPHAKYCSDACKQAQYRARLDNWKGITEHKS